MLAAEICKLDILVAMYSVFKIFAFFAELDSLFFVSVPYAS